MIVSSASKRQPHPIATLEIGNELLLYEESALSSPSRRGSPDSEPPYSPLIQKADPPTPHDNLTPTVALV